MLAMSTPVSQPVTPTQPDLECYGIQDLALFVSYTRDSYLAAFGVQAPAWDPSLATKTWFDTTVDTSNPANTATYNIVALSSSGVWGLTPLTMPASEAATVNLTGSVTYPAYVVAPTDATSGGAVINPAYLSLEADAQSLMNSLGGSNLTEETGNAAFPIVYPADEARRIWDFYVNGVLCNAGQLIAQMNANGVGAPGSWQIAATGPVWVSNPAPTGLDSTSPAEPMPVRNLLPNEVLQAGLMGVSVIRTDLEQQEEAQAGEFLPDDRATLQQIYQLLVTLTSSN
jgi:hypothetical protein